MELKPRQEDIAAFNSHVATRKQDALRAEAAARAQAEIAARKERYSDTKDFLLFAAKSEIDAREYDGANTECLGARATSWQVLSDSNAEGSPLTIECRYVQLAVVGSRLDHSSQKVQTRSDYGLIEVRSVNHDEGFEGKRMGVIKLYPNSMMLTGADYPASPYYDIDTSDQDKKVVIDDVINTVLMPLRSRLFREDPTLASYAMEE